MEDKPETSTEVTGEKKSTTEEDECDTINADMTPSGATAVPEKHLSKKQARKQRKEQEKLTRRKEKRAQEKLRRKAKRAAQREAGYVLPKRPRKSQMGNSNCKQRVAIDMSFENLMRPKDLRHLFVQLAHAYAANRRAENPLQFSVVGFSGPQNKQFFDNPNNHNWDVIFEERPLEKVFERSEIVYLTADSDNSLETLDNSKVYVIGGLLDHNSLKGHCLKLAMEKGYAHARLPIGEFITLQTRKVLTVNQVFEILLRYTENQSWKKSFLDVIPRRKGIVDSDSCVENTDDVEKQTHEAIDQTGENNDEKLAAGSEQIKPNDLSNSNDNC